MRTFDGVTEWAAIEHLASETGFSGVVRVDHDHAVVFARAYRLAHRAFGVANTLETRFAIASGTKGLTALTVMTLVEEGVLTLDTPARAWLGSDLPLVDDAVTVEHLLSHRSGIGDYVDESAGLAVTEYVLPVPGHQLATTEQYLAVLAGHRQQFTPGERFEYCNSGYVLLALLAERVTGSSYAELVQQRVCAPAGLTDTGFPRGDEPGERMALGYLDAHGERTNLLHLPVRGSGDGGAWSTAADVAALWSALDDGRIVSADGARAMVSPRSQAEGLRYGMGFWLHPTLPVAFLEGHDAGISFRSVHDSARVLTHTVLCNTSSGAWPLTRRLDEILI